MQILNAALVGALTLVASLPSVAETATTVSHVKDNTAYATFIAQTGTCFVSYTTIAATDHFMKDGDTLGARKSESNVSATVTTYNTCNGSNSVASVITGSAVIPKDAFKVLPKLEYASLNVSIPATISTPGSGNPNVAIGLTVQLIWDATGPVVNDVNHFSVKYPDGTKYHMEFVGKHREAVARGSVIFLGVNLAAGQSFQAEIARVRSGYQYVSKQQ